MHVVSTVNVLRFPGFLFQFYTYSMPLCTTGHAFMMINYMHGYVLIDIVHDWMRNDIANFSGRGYKLNSKMYVLTLTISGWIIELRRHKWHKKFSNIGTYLSALVRIFSSPLLQSVPYDCSGPNM